MSRKPSKFSNPSARATTTSSRSTLPTSPAKLEQKDVFGITFEQERNELVIGDDFFSNVVTENKELPEFAKRDLAIAMIALKYTQSNSVCYVKDGQCHRHRRGPAKPHPLHAPGGRQGQQLVAQAA